MAIGSAACCTLAVTMIAAMFLPAVTHAQPTKSELMRRALETHSEVVVPANVMWVPTGVTAKTGDTLTFAATGRWSNAGPPSKGPQGFDNYRHPGTIVESAALASLVGKIGKTTFVIGARNGFVASEDGQVFLSINDTPGTFGDNQGEMRVTITRAPRAPVVPVAVVPAPGPAPPDPSLPARKHEWQHTTYTRPTAAVSQLTSYENSDRDTLFQQLIAYADDSQIIVRDASTGNLLAQPYNTGATISNKPALVRLSDGRWYLFATSRNGNLYKIDIDLSRKNPGMPLQVAQGGTQINNRQRPTCNGLVPNPDRLTVTPLVQLAASSNKDFTLGEDIVIVATDHGCGSHTTNKVFALDAADITQPPLWTLNEDLSYQIDRWTSCILDYTRNALFCGTYRQSQSYQHTVWSINTSSGKRNWSVFGPIVEGNLALGNPAAGGVDHLYFTGANSLRALDPATGGEVWTFPLVEADRVGVLFTGLSGGAGTHGRTVIVTGTDNVIRAIHDGGSTGDTFWAHKFPDFPSDPRLTSGPEVASSIGKVYVGLSDGTVRQLSLTYDRTPTIEHAIIFGSAVCFGSVTVPTVYLRGTVPTLFASAQCGYGMIKQFSLPFQSPPQY